MAPALTGLCLGMFTRPSSGTTPTRICQFVDHGAAIHYAKLGRGQPETYGVTGGARSVDCSGAAGRLGCPKICVHRGTSACFIQGSARHPGQAGRHHNDSAGMTEQTKNSAHAPSHQLERLVFFSDAIFAIAITLLVLDLKLPAGSHGIINWSDIGAKLFAFALSFFVIGIYWINHHQLFGCLRKEDGILRWVNLLFLGTVIFLPFPTSVIAEFPVSSTSVPLYSATGAATGFLFAILALVARRDHLIDPAETRGASRRVVVGTLGAPSVFVVSAVVGATDPTLALRLLWLILPATWLAHRLGRRLEQAWNARHRPGQNDPDRRGGDSGDAAPIA